MDGAGGAKSPVSTRRWSGGTVTASSLTKLYRHNKCEWKLQAIPAEHASGRTFHDLLPALQPHLQTPPENPSTDLQPGQNLHQQQRPRRPPSKSRWLGPGGTPLTDWIPAPAPDRAGKVRGAGDLSIQPALAGPAAASSAPAKRPRLHRHFGPLPPAIEKVVVALKAINQGHRRGQSRSPVGSGQGGRPRREQQSAGTTFR
ncbi:MAG: hypothetical protein IPM75_12355 [Candidatus Competibacteraceae bacterium]|nr:hypothetical protein [Candidatus Competibacteraceae bacterium]